VLQNISNAQCSLGKFSQKNLSLSCIISAIAENNRSDGTRPKSR